MDRIFRIYLPLLFYCACTMIVSSQDITSAGVSLEECDPEMLGFELITGYVFTAPDDLLDSVPGTLMLTDCLEACQSNDSCHAVNYETGLCVLFSSNADNYPGKQMYLSIQYLSISIGQYVVTCQKYISLGKELLLSDLWLV